ncbi:MAG TPA: carbohydrate-binding protein [Thermoanaerobaculia bacterium]
MKTRLLLSISVALCLTILSARPGSAQALATSEPEWLSRMLQDGWRKVQEGVLQRNPGEGRVETFTYGEAGQRVRIQKLEARVRSLEHEYAGYPSAKLAQIIESLRNQLAEADAGSGAVRLRTESLSAAESESFAGEAVTAGCTPTLTATAAADPLPDAPGVTANASASYHSPCDDPGDTFAYAYARAIDESTQTTKIQEDPRYGGTSLDSTSTASVNGSLDCYSEAYASASSPSLGLSYQALDTNSACPAPVQWPFRTAFKVPGTIKAADFDNGADGVAYHEMTPDIGSSYRATTVDLYRDNVYRLEAGDWLEYTIDVETAGSYAVVAQVGSGSSGGSFHIDLDGVNVTGPLSVPDTGNWSLWGSAVKAPVKFTAGRHVLRFAVGSWFEAFYSLRIVPAQAPFGGTVRTLPGTIRVADFDEGGEQISYHDNTVGCDGSCGYRTADVDRYDKVVIRTTPGEWMEYTVDITSSRTYTFSVRVGADGGGGTFHIEINGVNVTGPLTFPNTGAWNVYQTVTKTGVSLTAGRKIMRIVVDSTGGHSEAGTFDTITIQ